MPSPREAMNQVGAVVVAALVFYLLADAADFWGGGLRPNPLWLATASTTAVALLLPLRFRPAAVVGGAIGCLIAGFILFDETLRSVATPCLGNTAESAIAVALIPRVFTSELYLGRTRRAVAWIFTSVFAAAVGAVIATSDTSSNVIGERVESMLRWTLGDTVGLLILPPLVVAFRAPWVTPRYRQWILEAMASVLALGILVWFAFRSNDPLPYVLVPAVMWIGIRFGPRLAAPAAFVTAMAATYLTSEGHGPFANATGDAVVQVQALNIALALSALVASAHAERAWRDQQRLRATLEALPDVIVTRDAVGRAVGAWGPSDLQNVVSDLVPIEPEPSDDPLARVVPADALHTVHQHEIDRYIEHRTVPIDADSSLHLFRDVSAEHRQASARLEMVHQIEDARLETRKLMARELHDGPIQSLAAARLIVEGAALQDPSNQNDRLLEALRDASEQLGAVMNRLARPEQNSPIGPALESFGSDVLRAVGATISVTDSTEVEIPEDVSRALVQIGREAILNAARHSAASRVVIDLRDLGPSVELVVRDDGEGFHPPEPSTRIKLGVTSMKLRASALGGSVIVENNSEAGTSMRARIPIDPSHS